MKKILLAVVALMFFASSAMAAGTVTVTRHYQSADGSQLVFKLACTGDSSDGSVPATTLNSSALSSGLSKPYWQLGYYLYEVWTKTPASGNPDAADISIADSTGLVLYSETNVISASTSTVTDGSVDKYRQVNSAMVITQSNQDTASATWEVYIKLSK